eukprot:TRINITY_DN7788_c4_g1_i1.p1 TRINITY_DN7788_c4_g1~~TRINITY_DN7788_c4_g1_i1.p1  ORF type:complete len:586 (+),score=116.86 TRINITY_DN7788_c4_g1_i1:103-1860(+)
MPVPDSFRQPPHPRARRPPGPTPAATPVKRATPGMRYWQAAKVGASGTVPPTTDALRQQRSAASPGVSAAAIGRARLRCRGGYRSTSLQTPARPTVRPVINLTGCKYPLLHEIAEALGFTKDEDDSGLFNIWWQDFSVSTQRVSGLRNWQRINHFPGMHVICRKDQLCDMISRIRRGRRTVGSDLLDFVPRTWSAQRDRSSLKTQTMPGTTYIVKPSSGCQGKGIFLTRNPIRDTQDLGDVVVQEYIENPLLIEGKKFDIRLYVLVTSVRNLSVFCFKEGLVRLCTEGYTAPSATNLDHQTMHLTNYAINSQSADFVFNTDAAQGDTGNKRDFCFLNSFLESQGHSSETVWKRIDRVVMQTLLAAQPSLRSEYDLCFPCSNDGFTCFEVLGFDLLIDKNLRPWLLEVNHSPSFRADTPLDARIKGALLLETLSLLEIRGDDKVKDRRRTHDRHVQRMAGSQQQASSPHRGSADPARGERDADEWLQSRLRAEDRRAAEGEIGWRRVYPTEDPSDSSHLARFRDIAETSMMPATTLASQAAAASQRRRREAAAAASVGASRAAVPRAAAAPRTGRLLQQARTPRVG